MTLGLLKRNLMKTVSLPKLSHLPLKCFHMCAPFNMRPVGRRHIDCSPKRSQWAEWWKEVASSYSDVRPKEEKPSSSIFGSQKDMEEQADAIIMYFGLNRTHWTALLWSPLRTQTFCPFSAFQMWIRPSVEPLITNWESGEKEASRGRFFELRWPVNDCSVAPL